MRFFSPLDSEIMVDDTIVILLSKLLFMNISIEMPAVNYETFLPSFQVHLVKQAFFTYHKIV